MYVGAGISFSSMSDIGCKYRQSQGDLGGGINHLIARNSNVHSRNIPKICSPTQDTDSLDSGGLALERFSVREIHVPLNFFVFVGGRRRYEYLGVIATTSVAHKSLRIRALDINRDLPSLPLDVDAGVFSFAHDSPTPTMHGRHNPSEM